MKAALDLLARVPSILIFLTSLTVVSECCSVTGVFSAAGEWMVRAGRGRVLRVWGLFITLSCLVTAFLSLDTTAVLMTPAGVTLARRLGRPPTVFVFPALWIANMASMWLPVSNLTSLLARDVLPQPSTSSYLASSWPLAITTTGVPIALSLIIFRRDLRGGGMAGSRSGAEGTAQHETLTVARSRVVDQVPARNRARMLVGTVVLVMSPALTFVEPAWAAGVAAVACWGIVCKWQPERRRDVRLPLASLGVTSALFVGVAVLHGLHALDPLTRTAGGASPWQLAVLGGFSANVINNLPAYLALEPATHGETMRVMALLVGVNVVSGITWWGSVATLLWRDRLQREGIVIGVREHVWRTGAVTLVTSVAALAVLTLLDARPFTH